MKNSFKVKLTKFTNLKELPNSRTKKDYISILESLDFDGIEQILDDELEEMCVMSLQDLAPEEAAKIIIKLDLGTVLKAGQIDHLSNEMLEEKLWEEYADLALHENFFNIGSLLYKAFPKEVPTPDAVELELEIEALNKSSQEDLSNALNESLLVRLIADGMDDHSSLKRLFEEQIKSHKFPEAQNIIWTFTQENTNEHTVKVTIISSGYWMDMLRNAREFESSAHPDEV